MIDLSILGPGGAFIVFGLLVAIATYLLEKYVTEEATKPGKLAYLVATVLVVVGVLVFLFSQFS